MAVYVGGVKCQIPLDKLGPGTLMGGVSGTNGNSVHNLQN